MIPNLINQERVLYLDADIIVNGSLADFYYSDLEGAPVGVVKDYCAWDNFSFPYLDANVSTNYFNSGVLLIDTVKWRENRRCQRCTRPTRTALLKRVLDYKNWMV